MDECSKLIRKIEERERIKGALVIKREKETGALIMIEIEGKMMKSVTNWGEYLMVMAIEWVRYLGIEDKINKTQVPKETNVTGNRVKFLERAQIRVRIGRKTIFWNTWIVDNIMIPFVIGMDIMKNSNLLLRDKKVWEYERERILVIITRKDVKNKGIATIVAIEKALLPKYSAQWVRGEIITCGKRKLKNYEIKITKIRNQDWKVNNGITQTKIDKNNRGYMESIYLKVENKNRRTTKIDKGDILALIKEIETIASIFIKDWRHELKHSVGKDCMKIQSLTMKTGKNKRREERKKNGYL